MAELDENNLPEGGTPTNSAVSSIDQSSGSLSLDQSLSTLSRPGVVPGLAGVGSAARYQEATGSQEMFDYSAAADNIATPNAFPEMYKDSYQGDLHNWLNAHINKVRGFHVSQYEDSLREIRVKLAEIELAEQRANDLLMEGLLSNNDHEMIVNKIRNGEFTTKRKDDNIVDTMLDLIGEKFSSREDYESIIRKSLEDKMLEEDDVTVGYLGVGDTYDNLIKEKGKIEAKIAEKERLIKEGGWGKSPYFGLPGYGGGNVDNDWQLRSEIEKNNPNYDGFWGGVGSSIPLLSKAVGLSDKWMGEEYFEHRAGEDLAGTFSTAEGQISSLVLPVIARMAATKFGGGNPYAAAASAVAAIGSVAWGLSISRNAESRMEAGEAYWQKVDALEKAYKDKLFKDEGITRELTRDEKNTIALAANEGVDALIKKNQALGASDLVQFLLTFAKIPAIGKSFNGLTTKMLGKYGANAGRYTTSSYGGRLGINATKFAAGVGISRELEGMEEGLQHTWTQDYLAGATQDYSGGFISNIAQATADVWGKDAPEYAGNMMGLINTDPDMYNSLNFKAAVQSGRDMATMMTGGARTVTNWGGMRGVIGLRQAMSLLGEKGDVFNANMDLNDKSSMLYTYFKNGKENDLYDALYRMARKNEEMPDGVGLTKEDAINAINEIREAKEIYNSIFDTPSAVAFNVLGLEYDVLGTQQKARSEEDKVKVFMNAINLVNKTKLNEQLRGKKKEFEEAQLADLDRFYTPALSAEELAELENEETSAERKAELKAKQEEGELSSKQKERIQKKMKERNLGTPYDLDIEENSQDIEQAKQENADIATGDKTMFQGVPWDAGNLEKYAELQKAIKELEAKEELSEAEQVKLKDMKIELNKMHYENAAEYLFTREGKRKHQLRRLVSHHTVGSILQHLEKYGKKGLGQILPNILDNNTKLDPATLEEVIGMSEEIVRDANKQKHIIQEIKDNKEKITNKGFNPATGMEEFHIPLTEAEKQELKDLRELESIKPLDQIQQNRLDNLTERAEVDYQLKELTEAQNKSEAELAKSNDVLDSAEKIIKRAAEDPDSITLRDEVFAPFDKDATLREAALEVLNPLEYIKNQLDNIPDYSDVNNIQQVTDQIELMMNIFKRRVVEAPENRKDYLQDITDDLSAGFLMAKGLLIEIKKNSANREQQQYEFEDRIYAQTLESIGLDRNFLPYENSVVGEMVKDLLGEEVLGTLSLAIKQLEEGDVLPEGAVTGLTDKMAVALTAVHLLKKALENSTTAKTELLNHLKEKNKAYLEGVKGVVESDIDSDIALENYLANPESGLRGLLQQIASINEDLDLNNKNSALWSFEDHLDPHRLLQELQKEDRSNNDVSVEVLNDLLIEHIRYIAANRLIKQLTSDFDIPTHLYNEKAALTSQEFTPTKQQLNAIRELSLFISSKTNKTSLGAVSAFMQGAAGTGKSKIVLPWVMATAGVPVNRFYAVGHSDTSSATINKALGIDTPNTINTFLDLDQDSIGALQVLIIDEAPSLTFAQYEALESKVTQENERRLEEGTDLLKVIMLGDEAQITTENVSPLRSFGTLANMNTLITPVTSIYRSDNPAIANFQDIFRRNLNDVSEQQIITKLNTANPFMPGAKGVYGITSDFKNRLKTKLSVKPEEGVRRAIITNPEKKEEYLAYKNANNFDVEVLTFIEAQGETIDEVYMDIEQMNMQPEDYNKALYTAASRAQELIIATNLNIKNTIDPQMHHIQNDLTGEFQRRATEFKMETEDNISLLNEFDNTQIEEDPVIEELEETEDTETNEEIEEDQNDDFVSEDTVEEEVIENTDVTDLPDDDPNDGAATDGIDITEELPEDSYTEDTDAYTDGDIKEDFNESIDVQDKHVVFYPEYDALSDTETDAGTILKLQSGPIIFVKAKGIAPDGTEITGIVMLQEARITVDKGNIALLDQGKRVYRRVGIVADAKEIDAMTFLSKKEKSDLKAALVTGAAVPLTSLDISGDKSLLRDESGLVSRKNLVKGVIIPENGARRLSYNYMSRDQLREDIPNAKNFKKENKNLIKNILKEFVAKFFDQYQKIKPSQLKNVKNARVRIYKKQEIANMVRKGLVPENFTLKSGRPYLVIEGVEQPGSKPKTQFIALTPRRISRDIADDVKNFYEPIDNLYKTAIRIEELTNGNLRLGTQEFTKFVLGSNENVKRHALGVGNPGIYEELLGLRDEMRAHRFEQVTATETGEMDSENTTGVGPAQKALNKLAQSNSQFREEKRFKRDGRKTRQVSAKSILAYTSKTRPGGKKGPLTLAALETFFYQSDEKGYNNILYLPLNLSDFKLLERVGLSEAQTSKMVSVSDNHKRAGQVLTSQLESIESSKIILQKSKVVEKKQKKIKTEVDEATKKTKQRKKRGGLGKGFDSKTQGKSYAETSDNKSLKGERITKEDTLKLLKQLLPDLFNDKGNLIPGNVVFLDALRMLDLTDNDYTLGKFMEQTIFLLEEREGIFENVVRHEVFHKIVAYYLTEAERKALFKAARTKYKLPASMTNAEVEERLAREFMKFRKNSNSVPAAIRRFFKKILKFLGFINKNADNINKLFDNIDSGYFSGNNMVGTPIDTNMNYQDIEKNWGNVETYREAKSWFIDAMDSYLSNYDGKVDDQGLITAEVNEETLEIYNVPSSRDEILNYIVENDFLEKAEEIEEVLNSKGRLTEEQAITYEAIKHLTDIKKAKMMFADVYNRKAFSEGYELSEDMHLDSVNLNDVINDANTIDHMQNLTESVIEVLTGISYKTADGRVKRLSIKHAYFKVLQLMQNTTSTNHEDMKRKISKRSRNLGHKKGSAGYAVEQALKQLIDTAFTNEIVTGKGRGRDIKINQELKSLEGKGRAKAVMAKRAKLRAEQEKLDLDLTSLPKNIFFVDSSKFIYTDNVNVQASDILHDVKGQKENFKSILREKGESSESYFYRIYDTLAEEGMPVLPEVLVAVNRKNQALRDLKNMFVNSASLREENFFMGDYEFEWNEEKQASDKKLRYFAHKEFGNKTVIKYDVENYVMKHSDKLISNRKLKSAAASLQNKIKKAKKNEDKIAAIKSFLNLIEYPIDKVVFNIAELDTITTKLDGFLDSIKDVGKRNTSVPKVKNEKGNLVYPTITMQDIIEDEQSLMDALADMIKIEHEASKAHSIRNVQGKTIYAFHNSSFGIDVISDLINPNKPTPKHLKEGSQSWNNLYQYNIFANGQSSVREIHDWDGTIDRNRKYNPITYSSENEKQWLDRNFSYWFLTGMKEYQDGLYYTQQLTTVSDKSSPKAAQVKLLGYQGIKNAAVRIVQQYNNKPVKGKSLAFSNILQNKSYSIGKKTDLILKELEKRSEEIYNKLESENILKNNSNTIDKALKNLKLKDSKELVKMWASNYAINSFFLNQLVLGDTAAFKDSYDVVKRMSIAFAPGYRGFVNPQVGMDEKFTLAVMEDPTGTAFDFLSAQEKKQLQIDLKELGLESSIDIADAQGFILPRRLKQLRRGFGGGLKIGTVMKPVYFGIDETGKGTAVKYSTVVLSDDLVGRHKGLKALRDAMEAANEGMGIDELVMASGIKLGMPKTLSPNAQTNKGLISKNKLNIETESIVELDNNNLRLQLDPAGDPNALVSNPSQLTYMIDTNGLNAKEAQDYYSALGRLITLGTREFFDDLGLLRDDNIVDFTNLSVTQRKAVEKKIRKKALKSASATESAHKEAEILNAKGADGKPAVTINFPGIVNKVYQMLSSNLQKLSINVKFPGSKLVLQTGYGATVFERPDGSVTLYNDITKLAEERGVTVSQYIKSENLTERPLQHLTVGKPYAEVLMPRVHSGKFKIGDEVYQNEFMMGFRIPSTELHSSVALKVVGFYDAQNTNVVIAPKEMQTIHGSDFDVDALFVIRKAHSSDKDKSGKSLYTNEEKGLVGRNSYLFLGPNETIPHDDWFIGQMYQNIQFARRRRRKLYNEMKLTTDEKVREQLTEERKLLKRRIDAFRRVEQAALKNKMLQTFVDLIQDPKNRESILTPISMKNFKGDVKDGKDVHNSVFGMIAEDMGLEIQDGHGELYQTKDLTNPLDEMYMHQSNQQGSKLTGAGAIAMKGLAYMMKANYKGEPAFMVSNRKSENGKTTIEPYKFTIDNVDYGELVRYEKRPNGQSSNYTIWQTMDSITNAAIDNAKEQILNIINMNQATAASFYVMIGTGVPLHTAVRLLLQPAMREATRRYPGDLQKGIAEVREEIQNRIGEKGTFKGDIQESVSKLQITTPLLRAGVKRTNPKLKLSESDMYGKRNKDMLFQLRVLELFSPTPNNVRGLISYGKDMTKLATTLDILRKLPANHEDLGQIVVDMETYSDASANFGWDVSKLSDNLPHLAATSETVSAFHGLASQLFEVNSKVLRDFAGEVLQALGKTSTSDERLTSAERNKQMREEYVRFISSSLLNTRAYPPIRIERGGYSFVVSGPQALSHGLGQEINNLPPSTKVTNSFLNRVSVIKDKRGVNYLKANIKGITQTELVEVYADFKLLDPKMQQSFLEYSIAVEGMLFGSGNITMMLRPEMFGGTKTQEGYDTTRNKLMFEMLKTEVKDGRSERLENSKTSFMLQYALSNINLIASVNRQNIMEALVEEKGSKFGSRKAIVPSTGDAVFYNLKFDKSVVADAPLFMANNKFGQVYIKVFEEVETEESKGYAYYQEIAKGTANSSFYSAREYELSDRYKLETHFPSNHITRVVENPLEETSIDLNTEVKGLQKGDKMILRTSNDVMRLNALVATVESVEKITIKDKETETTSTKYRVKFAKDKGVLSDFIKTPTDKTEGISPMQEDQKTLYQKVSDGQTMSQEGMEKIVEKLERRFGFRAKVINDPSRKWAGKFVAGTPVINAAYAKKDTPFHEFAHPWIEAIFIENRPLFDKLVHELKTTSEGRAILAKVKQRYPNLGGNPLYKEALATAIGEYAGNMIDEKGNLYSIVTEILKYLGNLIKKIFNPKAEITPADLSGMGLKELAALMAMGDSKLVVYTEEFTKSARQVTKEGFLQDLQNRGIVSPGQVQGRYAIMDNIFDEVRRDEKIFQKNAAIVDKLVEDFPGLIRRSGNDVIFDFKTPIEDFEANAQYQLVEEPEADTKPIEEEKIVEGNTLAELEEVKRRERLKLSKDETKYEGKTGVYERLTHFVKTGILGHKKDTVDSEFAAKRIFERNKKNVETDTILIEGESYTYEDLVNKFQKRINNSTARGKAVHKIMEYSMNGDSRILKELDAIQKEKKDQDEITDQSLAWVRSIAEGALRRIGIKSSDTMKAELMLHSNILETATQIDGLIQHTDGTLTMVDWKSGSHFLSDRAASDMMRYSSGTMSDINNSKVNRAMLELAIRAMMVKEHMPNAKFRNIFVQHLDRNNPFKAPLEVHLADYLKIISNYLQAEKPAAYAEAKAQGLLDANNYTTQKIRNSAVLSKYEDLPIDQQIEALEKEIEIVRTRIATPGMSNDMKSDKELLETLTNHMLDLTKTSKEKLTSEKDLGMLKTWSSAIYNIASPRIQAFNKIFRRASNKVNNRVEDEKRKAEVLFKAVRDEYMRKNPRAKIQGIATLGASSGFTYKDMYRFAFEERVDGVQTPGTYMISVKDAKKKYDAGDMTKAQYELIEHLHTTWNREWDALMSKKMEGGKVYSQIMGLHNVDNAVIDGKLHENFMPRIPMETWEAYERYEDENIISRNIKGFGTQMKMWGASTFSLFIEQDYYSQGDVINNHIPVRFMGSQGIIADSIHSFNLENMHYQFTGNLMRKQEMDYVVALGDGLKSYYSTMKGLRHNNDKAWGNYEKFMENFVINAVMQERTAGRGGDSHWSSKQWTFKNPFGFDSNRPKSQFNREYITISPFKLMMALKHFTTGKALWFKVIGGTFNGAIILMYTVMKGIQGSTAKRLGLDPGAIDVTMSDLAFGFKEVGKYFGAQIKHAVDNKPINNKLFNLMKRTKYLPDNYDYAVGKADQINTRNPLLTSDKLFFFHAIHEEWGHAVYLASQLRRMKMPDGSSLYDNYNDDGTFMKYKNGKRNVRGVVTDPSGQKRIVDELTVDELNRLLKASTDIHGAYRSDERSVLESTAIGVWFLQFKKYLPALLIQEWESRKDDVNLGQYEALTDENGNKLKVEIEIDGQMVELDALDWMTWQHEGRAKMLAKAIAAQFGTESLRKEYVSYNFENLNDRDKADVLGLLSKFVAYIMIGFMMAGLEDDDETALFQRMKYLQKDALQGLMPGEILRTMKNPIAVISHMNNLMQDVGAGDPFKSLQKDLPFTSVAYELERYGVFER